MASAVGGRERRDPAAPRDRIGLAALVLVVLMAAVWSAFVQPSVLRWLPVVPHVLICGIGVFIVLRTAPEHRLLGWLLATNGLFVTSFVATPVFEQSGSTVAGIVEATASLWLLPLLLAIILYPTGRPASSGLRILAFLAVVNAGLATAFWLAANLGWIEATADPLDVAVALNSVPTFLSFFEQARIYRRRPPDQQKQIKWAVLSLPLVPVMVAPRVLGWSEESFAAIQGAATLVFPVVILVGITRYRLYEVDRLVSRTVAYTVVVVLLGGTFVGGVTVLTAFLPARDNLAVAVTTAVVVALASPVLRRVRDVVDRRFDRTSYEAQEVVQEFGRAIQVETDLDAVRDGLHDVIARTAAPSTVALWEPTAADGGQLQA